MLTDQVAGAPADLLSARVLVRALREARGVTQQGWAAALGYSLATVRRWESGTAVPTAEAEENLLAYCRQRGLLRQYDSGPLRGHLLSEEVLRAVLAEARLQAARPASPAEPVAPVSAPAAPTPLGADLPNPLTRLIARDAEVALVRKALESDRLVTLTGPGGAGKTRIALEVARSTAREQQSTVTWVDLAPLHVSTLVLPSIAQSLGVREVPGEPLARSVQDVLRTRRHLLVLDNFEHVLDAAPLLADLLRACEHLRVLVTSRARLQLYGEHDLPVQPLAVPPAAGEQAPAVEALMAFPSVVLFVERARAADPSFHLTPANSEAVAAICRRLDGLPLALELAAARTRVLSPEAVLARLSQSLALLAGGPHDLPRRQQTLLATLEWSYSLLDPAAQGLFRRLGAFAGGCTEAAVEAICAEANGDAAPATLDLLQQLVDESLLVREPSPDGLGEPRFSMLETIRTYAEQRLAADAETDRLRERHAAYFLQLAEQAEPRLVGPDQAAWLERLDRDHVNLRTALRWSLEAGQRETSLRLASTLWRFWETRGLLGEGQQWLEQALALAPAATSLDAKALTAAGSLARLRGDLDRARTLHTASLELFRALGDEAGIARALSNLGVVAKEQGHTAEASELYQESLGLRRKLGDEWAVAALLVNLGEVAREQGDLEQARRSYAESRVLFEGLGDTVGIAVTLNNLGEVARELGDLDAAVTLHQRSYTLRQQLGDRVGVARSLEKLARLAYDQGQHQQARSLFLDSLRLCRELGAELDALHCLEGLAEVTCALGQPYPAARLLAAIDTRRTSTGRTLTADRRVDHERALATVRQALAEAAYAAAWAEGQLTPVERAAELADAHAEQRPAGPGTAPASVIPLPTTTPHRHEDTK